MATKDYPFKVVRAWTPPNDGLGYLAVAGYRRLGFSIIAASADSMRRRSGPYEFSGRKDDLPGSPAPATRRLVTPAARTSPIELHAAMSGPGYSNLMLAARITVSIPRQSRIGAKICGSFSDSYVGGAARGDVCAALACCFADGRLSAEG
jgi:hypothetical protein